MRRVRPLDDEIHEPREGVKPDDVRRIRNKVGERVHVVIIDLTVAVVDEIFHTADVDVRGAHDALYIFDDLARRVGGFYPQSEFR